MPNFWYDGTFTKKSDDPKRWAAFIQKERDQITELLTWYGPSTRFAWTCIGARRPSTTPMAWPSWRAAFSPTSCSAIGASSEYGDYETPEGKIPEDPNQVKRPWQVIYPCGGGFSYQERQFKSREWILESLIDIVAKGGNFQAGFGPGPDGKWQQEMIGPCQPTWRLAEGERRAIFATRPYMRYHEGADLRFTRTKDKKYRLYYQPQVAR